MISKKEQAERIIKAKKVAKALTDLVSHNDNYQFFQKPFIFIANITKINKDIFPFPVCTDYYLTQLCKKESLCNKLHIFKDNVCTLYQKGQCPRRELCQFPHIYDEMLFMLNSTKVVI